VGKSDLERELAKQIQLVGLPQPQVEFRFWPKRRFRFDFAYPDLLIAIEVEGGQWIQGRHQRPMGFENDMIKYNEAAIRGWLVLRFTGRMIKSGEAITAIERAFKLKNGDKVMQLC
jgi:very-short-patch-repair endonuclease